MYLIKCSKMLMDVTLYFLVILYIISDVLALQPSLAMSAMWTQIATTVNSAARQNAETDAWIPKLYAKRSKGKVFVLLLYILIYFLR